MNYTTLDKTWIVEPYNPYTGTWPQWQKRLAGQSTLGAASNAILESGGVRASNTENIPWGGNGAVIPGNVRQNAFTAGYPYS